MKSANEYKQEITRLMENCEDISLLDFIYQLLQKSQQA